jgi:hypothetical protein
VFASHLAPKKIRGVLAGDDGIQILLDTLGSVGLTPPSGFMATGSAFLEIPQSTKLLNEMLPDAADLSPEQCAASDDDNGALLPKDFLLGAIHPRARETGILQGTKLL